MRPTPMAHLIRACYVLFHEYSKLKQYELYQFIKQQLGSYSHILHILPT